jgi:hypothetical protein
MQTLSPRHDDAGQRLAAAGCARDQALVGASAHGRSSAAYAEKPPVERFLAFVAGIAAVRHGGPSWPMYERLKGDFLRQCPDATPQEYERVMRAVARAAGV